MGESLDRYVVVRFASALPDLEVTINNIDRFSIQELINYVRERVPECRNKHLKMVCQGRLLSPLCTVSRAIQGNWAVTPAAETSERAFIHCIIGPELTPEQIQQEQHPEELSGMPGEYPSTNVLSNSGPRGFDRLLEAGFGEDEIATLRNQFHQLRGTDLNALTEDAIRQAEDNWIDNPAQEQATEELEMTQDMVLTGAILGFFGGPFAFFFRWHKSLTPFRMQLAIVLGLLLNFVLAFVRSLV
ncbi:fungal protein [Schizosaccharomyces japonicus yFS275]|uniref:Fungal protein n=1 Tax=Schizosaccharomyces japonicus (strain yFS275 / FY16936) TaxID=402676 RepID=B6K0Y5_SCHJY|nr:fungal protein [Schizosaccharomyces japonicus yFS275]EEB07606.1 fungal protein [Schizosaccharomyces japonicus yFS275]